MEHRHLVILRAGRNSLHPTWLDASRPRNWALYVCPYQPLQLPTDSVAGVTVGDVIPGPKWSGLRTLLESWSGWRGYDYVWLPDDDVFAPQSSIDRMFELARALSLDLCAPALHEASYYAHYSTMRNRRCIARLTGFVEIMLPCFSRGALEKLLPTLASTSTGWGWGLDSLWPKMLEYRNLGVIDDTPVLHTRPVGGFRDAELGRRVLDESDRIMADNDCRQVHTTFAAIGTDLQPLALSPEALAARLVDGWRYLIDANPSVLPWIVEAQRPAAGWGAYPVAGTPAGGTRHLP
ncbi:MAG TPA: hypothetical protein VEA81_17645 [Burkholderiaceae bacterium]|nr:hypothetical protein [Burkholderiaceae bacterium]